MIFTYYLLFLPIRTCCTEILENFNDKAAYAPANVADDAVGVPKPQKKHWYIAIVAHRSERTSSRLLTNLGYTNYVASQWEVRTWSNGRTKRVERIVLPARIFIRTTEDERLRTIVNLPFIYRFVTDRARKKSTDSWAPAAIVPDKEMEDFRRMLGQEEFPVFLEDSNINYANGDKVRVIAGRLAGMEGTVIAGGGEKRRLYVSLDILGRAFVEIDKNYLAPIDA